VTGSNSAGSLEAAELTDLEAIRLAQQIASERFLPISARHYETHLERQRRGSPPDAYDRTDLESVWVRLLSEAVAEVETVRIPAVVKKLQDAARTLLAVRYSLPQTTTNPPPARSPPGRY
jgi:hypothetical protein